MSGGARSNPEPGKAIAALSRSSSGRAAIFVPEESSARRVLHLSERCAAFRAGQSSHSKDGVVLQRAEMRTK